MPAEVLRNVKSTVVPTTGTDPDDADADKQLSISKDRLSSWLTLSSRLP